MPWLPAEPSRRNVLAIGAALPVATVSTASVAAHATVASDLDRYGAFGTKQAGSPGDDACGAWLATELERLGYAIERQRFSAPFFEARRSALVCGSATAAVWPQPIVTPTGDGGIFGPLVRVDANGQADAPLRHAVALVDLPYGRWSTALARAVRAPILAAFASGAAAVVAITNGPTGKTIALNADGRTPMFPGPVALLAPEDARPFLAAAVRRETATLFVTGTGGRRPAFNLIGRIDRGRKRWLAVSTPRSGWHGCVGERGSGIAVWLWLARWAQAALPDHDLAFLCNSGHEYEYLGAAEALRAIAPRPAETHFWLHLGANVAARDWHETPGSWRPLPSVDPQRFFAISPALLPLARRTFAGHAGLEAPYSSETLSGGELTEIIAAGYPSVAGVFGAHRFHHVATDDGRCVSPAAVATTAAAFQTLVARIATPIEGNAGLPDSRPDNAHDGVMP